VTERAEPEASRACVHEAETLLQERGAVVVDDGGPIPLTVYGGAGATASVGLDPIRAIAAGLTLIEAAKRYLEQPDGPKGRGRGGDPYSERRRDRNEGLCALARLTSADLNLEQRTAVTIAKASRYRPAPCDAEGTPERQALHRIAAAGLPIPSRRQVRRIIEPTLSSNKPHWMTSER